MTAKPFVHYHIVTIFPSFFDGTLSVGLFGKAVQKGLIRVSVYDLRRYASSKYGHVDDDAYGGGPGMVLSIGPLVKSLRDIQQSLDCAPEVVAFTPCGERFEQDMVQAYAHRLESGELRHMVLYCGRYEGFDERFLENYVDRRVRVSEAVFMGGEGAAVLFCEAVSRLLSGVVGNPESLQRESFISGQADYPVYTRPNEFEGLRVPDVLQSGDHQKIEVWRQKAAERLREKFKL